MIGVQKAWNPLFFGKGEYRVKAFDMLISVHLPKTAGSSFGLILKKEYEGKILLDYEDRPINTTVVTRHQKALADAQVNRNRDFGEIQCIYGHFMPTKYLPLKQSGKAKFICWLREPLAKMLSHYNFWKRTYCINTEKGALHCKVVEKKWSLEQFCFSSEMHNFYAQFLWEFPIELFDFIGITERFDEDLQTFGKTFLNKNNLVGPRENVAPAESGSWSPSNEFRARFEEYHSEDYRMYREGACHNKTQRIATIVKGRTPVTNPKTASETLFWGCNTRHEFYSTASFGRSASVTTYSFDFADQDDVKIHILRHF